MSLPEKFTENRSTVPDKLTDEEREAMERVVFNAVDWRPSFSKERGTREKTWLAARDFYAARGSVSLPDDKVEVDAKMLDGANRAALSLAEQLEAAEARLASLETALRDLLDWAEHIEGDGKLRRTEAIGQAQAALSAAPSRTPNTSKSDPMVGDSAAPSTGERFSTADVTGPVVVGRIDADDSEAVEWAGVALPLANEAFRIAEDEEAAVERVAEALEELLSQHEAGYTFPPPGVVGQGDVRSEAWDAARAAIAAFRGVGEAK